MQIVVLMCLNGYVENVEGNGPVYTKYNYNFLATCDRKHGNDVFVENKIPAVIIILKDKHN